MEERVVRCQSPSLKFKFSAASSDRPDQSHKPARRLVAQTPQREQIREFYVTALTQSDKL
jgi:hypothetical protein